MMELILGLITNFLSSLVTVINLVIKFLNSLKTEYNENDLLIKKYSAQISPKIIGTLVTRISSITDEVNKLRKQDKKSVIKILKKNLKQEIVVIKSEVNEQNVKADINKIADTIDICLEKISIKVVNKDFLKFLNDIIPTFENIFNEAFDTLINVIQQNNIYTINKISKIFEKTLKDSSIFDLNRISKTFNKLSVDEEINNLMEFYATQFFEHDHIKCYKEIKSMLAYLVIRNFGLITNEFRLKSQQSRIRVNDIISKVLKDDINSIILEIQSKHDNLSSSEIRFLIDSALTQFSNAIGINEAIEHRQYIESKVNNLVYTKIEEINENIEIIGAQDPKDIYNVLNSTLRTEFDAIAKKIERESINISKDEISKEISYAAKKISLIFTVTQNYTSVKWFDDLVSGDYY